jgi:acetyl esterase
VKISRYDGMIHGFFSMGAVLDQGNKAIAEAAEALKVAFRK